MFGHKKRPCPKCGEKIVGAFSKDRTRPDGLQVLCRVCSRAAMAKVRSRPEFKERQRERWRKWYHEDPRGSKANPSPEAA